MLLSMVMRCKVKYTNFQLENSNDIISDLIDRDSCSNIVGYIYNEKLAQKTSSTTDLFIGLEAS